MTAGVDERAAVFGRRANASGMWFYCPGCREPHQVLVGLGPGPRWAWDGGVERPTLRPSICVTWREWQPQRQEYREHCCHSFVTDGRIQFLGDCTHALAGQTVDLPQWESAP